MKERFSRQRHKHPESPGYKLRSRDAVGLGLLVVASLSCFVGPRRDPTAREQEWQQAQTAPNAEAAKKALQDRHRQEQRQATGQLIVSSPGHVDVACSTTRLAVGSPNNTWLAVPRRCLIGKNVAAVVGVPQELVRQPVRQNALLSLRIGQSTLQLVSASAVIGPLKEGIALVNVPYAIMPMTALEVGEGDLGSETGRFSIAGFANAAQGRQIQTSFNYSGTHVYNEEGSGDAEHALFSYISPNPLQREQACDMGTVGGVAMDTWTGYAGAIVIGYNPNPDADHAFSRECAAQKIDKKTVAAYVNAPA